MAKRLPQQKVEGNNSGALPFDEALRRLVSVPPKMKKKGVKQPAKKTKP